MEDIERAADIILNSGVVLFPTDTVFGLSANAFDDSAVEKIYNIKHRDKKKPLPVLVADYTDLLKLVETPSRLEGSLIEAFWPGPLTIVLKRLNGVSERASAGLDTIAVRMPDSEVVRNLIREAGVPLATTSANLSGEPAGLSLDDISQEVLDSVDFVLEDDKKHLDTPSTIVQVVGDEIKILREDAISRETLLDRIKKI